MARLYAHLCMCAFIPLVPQVSLLVLLQSFTDGSFQCQYNPNNSCNDHCSFSAVCNLQSCRNRCVH